MIHYLNNYANEPKRNQNDSIASTKEVY